MTGNPNPLFQVGGEEAEDKAGRLLATKKRG